MTRSPAATAPTRCSAATATTLSPAGAGTTLAQLGDGDDTFVWNPGDGSDTVDGGAGLDTLLFNGANVSEKIDISANGGRVRFFRDVGNVTMDLNSIETIKFTALGGADNIAVHDLTGTGVKQVAIDLASPPGSGVGDGAADNVTVDGTANNDRITIQRVRRWRHGHRDCLRP